MSPTNSSDGLNSGAAARPRASLPWEAPAAQGGASKDELHALLGLKSRIHRRLLERLNLSNLDKLDRDEVKESIRRVVHDLLLQETVPLNFDERERLVGQ